MQDFAILFADGDADERRVWYVNSIQIRDSKLSDAELIALGGPSAGGIPLVIGAEAPPPPEEAELFFSVGAGGLTLSWDETLTGFILESTTDLGSNQWAPVAGVSNNSITIQMSEPARFYRLKQ